MKTSGTCGRRGRRWATFSTIKDWSRTRSMQKEVQMSDYGRSYEGSLQGEGLSVGIVVSRFNEFICNKLLTGAMDCLNRHGCGKDKLETAWVPGAWEIPLVALRMARSGRYDAVLCLGAVIRGSTPHFDYVAAEVSKGISRVSQDTGVPVAFGVLTTDTIEQAIERAGSKGGNKGWDAALSALEMASLLKEMESVGF